MNNVKVVNPIIYVFCGFAFGIIFTAIVGFVGEPNSINNKDPNDGKILLKPGVFGDIKVEVIELNKEDPFYGDGLMISKGDTPFISINKNASGEIKLWGVTNGKKGTFAYSEFKNDKISTFALFGNNDSLVFSVLKNEETGEWHRARYNTTNAIKGEDGKVQTYEPVGNVYEDIDFDGSFDVKHVMGKNFKVEDEYIYLSGKWVRILLYKFKELKAVGFNKALYEFENGKGWKVVEE